MNLSAICRYFGRAASLLLLLGIGGNAQSIRIKLVNGRNGRPFANTHVNVWVGTERKEAIAIPTDEKGVARVQLTLDTAKVNIPAPSKDRGSIVVANPVVKYSDTIAINVPYVLCETRKSNYSWLAIRTFATAEVLQHGIVTANRCGKAEASPQAGEIIIFVRPLTWWEALKT